MDQTIQHPAWASLIADSPEWRFDGQKLVHRDFSDARDQLGNSSSLQQLLVDRFWAVQRNSTIVRRGLSTVLERISENGWGVNIGAGQTRLHERIINVDIFRDSNIDVVNVGNRLPFIDSCMDCVVSMEVLEHVNRPHEIVAEAFRVLKPGGQFYCQVPFTIGYHPGPHDFWRFSKEGLRELFAIDAWDVKEIVPTLGHGSGMYRILVEFMAVNASIVFSRLYKPTKGICSIVLSPLCWLDALTKYSPEADRIAGGYYCIARKGS